MENRIISQGGWQMLLIHDKAVSKIVQITLESEVLKGLLKETRILDGLLSS